MRVRFFYRFLFKSLGFLGGVDFLYYLGWGFYCFELEIKVKLFLEGWERIEVRFKSRLFFCIFCCFDIMEGIWVGLFLYFMCLEEVGYLRGMVDVC